MSTKTVLIWALASGALFLLAYPPFEQSYIAWIGLIPVIFCTRRKNPMLAWLSGYLWGLVFFGAGLFWVNRLSGIGWVLVTLYLSLYPAFFFLIARKLHRRYWEFKTALAGVVIEATAAHLFTGFPWLNLSLSQYSFEPILTLASFGGPYLITFLVLLINLTLFSLITRREKIGTAPAIFAIILLLSAGGFTNYVQGKQKPVVSGPGLRFAAVQASVPSSLRQQGPVLEPYLKQTGYLREKVDLIIWPETTFASENGVLPESVKALLKERQCHLLAGVLEIRGRDRYNSAILYEPDGDIVSVYRKNHLVPFGEFTPGASLPPVRFLVTRQAGFLPDLQRGREPGVMKINDVPLTVFICYEDVFPEEVVRAQKIPGSVIVVLTNDSWLGPLGSFQHFGAAGLRAAENKSYLIRTANTGITACFNPEGLVVNRLPLQKKDILTGIVRPGQGQSPYRMAPLLFPFLALALSIILSGSEYFYGKRKHLRGSGVPFPE